ncbi:hypothetical protein K5549_005769 [Capra hircus]|nr:hypothetical protein K5549_005769 [Capra hircus]
MSSSQPGSCPCQGAAGRPTILYTLLSPSVRDWPSVAPARGRCLCRQHRPVQLCTPHRTCQEALDVLAKTLAFLRNLPSFCQLPSQGLAQDTVTFQVAEVPMPSILKKILLEKPSSGAGSSQRPDRPQPSLAEVQWLQCCLESFWSLELGPKEYAYLKGTVLFNPEVPGLYSSSHIGHLQQEAHQALWEVLEPWCPAGQSRLARVLLTASTLKSIPPSLLGDLFLRPVIGDVDIADLLEDMLLLS